MKPVNRGQAAGLSLIELMIALLIGVILLLGVVQIFAASRTAYQLSEGLARTQENGRFAMDYLQRDIRMAGHFGCINDQARLQTVGGLNTHFSIADNPLNFNVSIRGYEAVATAPTDTINLSSLPSGGWSPAPPFLGVLSPAPHAGSDIIAMRYLTSDGVPVTNLAAGNITVDASKWNVLTNDGVASPRLFGIADCTFADVFHSASFSPGTGVINVSVAVPNVSVPDFLGRYTASPAGQTMLYRAESVVYYVGTGTGGGPSLFRARFNSATAAPATEELVEGIENLQFIYGQDEAPLTALSGNITAYNTAQTLGTIEADWRRVGQVQVAVLARSPNAAAAVATPANPLRALGTIYAGPTPADSRYRTTYESTIALRNRLYGN